MVVSFFSTFEIDAEVSSLYIFRKKSFGNKSNNSFVGFFLLNSELARNSIDLENFQTILKIKCICNLKLITLQVIFLGF